MVKRMGSASALPSSFASRRSFTRRATCAWVLHVCEHCMRSSSASRRSRPAASPPCAVPSALSPTSSLVLHFKLVPGEDAPTHVCHASAACAASMRQIARTGCQQTAGARPASARAPRRAAPRGRRSSGQRGSRRARPHLRRAARGLMRGALERQHAACACGGPPARACSTARSRPMQGAGGARPPSPASPLPRSGPCALQWRLLEAGARTLPRGFGHAARQPKVQACPGRGTDMRSEEDRKRATKGACRQRHGSAGGTRPGSPSCIRVQAATQVCARMSSENGPPRTHAGRGVESSVYGPPSTHAGGSGDPQGARAGQPAEQRVQVVVRAQLAHAACAAPLPSLGSIVTQT